MAHRRSFRGRGISDAQRRKKSWIQVTGPALANEFDIGLNSAQTPNLNFPLQAETPTGDVFSSSIGLFSDNILDKVPAESTILRLRGSVNLPKNEIDPLVITNYAVGIGVMESGAAQLGAFPNPASPDGGAWDGWMFYRSQQAGSLDANATVFDVKSMRKVQSGFSIIIVFGQYLVEPNGGTLGAVAATAAQMNLRGLILLP